VTKGFELDFWDYITFVTLFLMGAAFVAVWVWLMALPGQIAVKRRHPDAEAMRALGYAGLLPTIYPWMQALIWAFKPTDIVDIRRFPRAEALAIDEEIRRLGGGEVLAPAAPKAAAREGPAASPVDPGH
jgi:hypothetical protein